MRQANGKVAFVTGASLGIGAGTALALADAGYDLVVSATRLENLAATVASIKARGAAVTPVVLDLRSHASIAQAMEQAIAAYGRLDVLVNNAGVTLRKKALDVTRDDWHGVMQTNLTGTFFITQRMGRHLVASKRPGAIVCMASTHGLVGFATRSVYGISKAAIMQMTRMLAVEWAAHGIRVNALAPGRVDSQSPARAENVNDPNYMRMAMARVPLHRSASIDEVAAAVCYLASADAAYMTGQTLVLDGGLSAQ
jgi:NAD(P)-dependent dehydrogenase (short-subunit alcohol dehydrogenase family)